MNNYRSNSNSNSNMMMINRSAHREIKRKWVSWIGLASSVAIFALTFERSRSPLSSSSSSSSSFFTASGTTSTTQRRLAALDPKTIEFKPEVIPPEESSSGQLPPPPPTHLQQEGDVSFTYAAETTVVDGTSSSVQDKVSLMPWSQRTDVVFGDPSKPSYIQLCEAIVERHENPAVREKLLVVHESPAVCETQESYAAMTAIMTSALIAHAGSHYRLSYQHKCHDAAVATAVPFHNMQYASIQQLLPPDLSFGIGVTAQEMVSKCNKCLPLQQTRHLVECISFPHPGQLPEPVDPMLASFRIAGFRQNVERAVETYRFKEQQRLQPQPQPQQQETGLAAPTSTATIPVYGGAVVVLDLDSEMGDDKAQTYVYPLSHYYSIIPSTVSSIGVLVTQRCIEKIPDCQEHGQYLAQEFQKQYPQATIHGEILTGTALAYTRVLQAPILVCPPTLFCLLPSLYSDYSRASFFTTVNSLYPWYQYVARENRKLMGKTIELGSDGSVPIKSLKYMDASIKAFMKTSKSKSSSSSTATKKKIKLKQYGHMRRRQRRRLMSTALDPKTVELKPEPQDSEATTATTANKSHEQIHHYVPKPKQPVEATANVNDNTNNNNTSSSSSNNNNNNVVHYHPGQRSKYERPIPEEVSRQYTPYTKDVETALSDASNPSHVQLCEALVTRHKEFETKGVPPGTPKFVVQESPQICQTEDSFLALTTMLASTMIAEAASVLRISYQHNCQSTITQDHTSTTIQQMMPPHLTLQEGLGLERMVRRCNMCSNPTKPMLQCLGYPTEHNLKEMVDPMIASLRYTGFRHNIQAAVEKVRQLELQPFNDRNNSSNDMIVYPPTNGGYTIYLDQVSTDNSEVWVLPMRYYAEVIPRHVSSILVVINQRCPLCLEYGEWMVRLLHEMYPRAMLRREVVSSTAVAFARIMEAPHVICNPTQECLMPAMFDDFSRSYHLTRVDRLYFWFFYLAREKKKKWTGHQIDLQEDFETHRLDNSSLEKLVESSLLQPPNDENGEECLNLRGRVGSWVQDMDYARVAQYASPLKRFREFPTFTPTEEHPFRSATAYRWQDAMCPVNLVTMQGLCDVTKSMGMTRIHLVGDSLNMQLAQSLWKLLGHEDDPVVRTQNTDGWQQSQRFQWQRDIQCPNEHPLELVYTRNDLADGNDDDAVAFDKIGQEESFNCGFAEYCLPWIRSYNEYSKGNTLLVVNIGSHVHELEDYHDRMHEFLGLMAKHQKPQDVIMFRTTVPGHENCQDPKARPLASHDEFARDLVEDKVKSWHLFPEYNDIAQHLIGRYNNDNRHAENDSEKQINVLDVYPMTVLRRDGHTAGPENCSTCQKDDCLHYILPGPLDWWTHLLYSNLLNIAHLRQNRKHP